MKLVAKQLIVLWGTMFACYATAAEKRRGYFISIDGINGHHLQKLVQNGDLKADRGLAWLYQNSAVSQQAITAGNTLTAASHVSTITCSYPSQHGITANSFLVKGEKVNGFSHTIHADTLWEAAQRQGKKVISITYVGADGKTKPRTATLGLAYPSRGKVSKSRTMAWKLKSLEKAKGWVLTKAHKAKSQWVKQVSFPVTLNPKTKEAITLHALLTKYQNGNVRLTFDRDRNLTNGFDHDATGTETDIEAIFDHFYSETKNQSGIKRHFHTRVLQWNADGLKLHVSEATYNNAYPVSFRAELDAKNLIWPDNRKKFAGNLSQLVDAAGRQDAYLAAVARHAAENHAFDILLFYQPLIDSTGHKLEAKLPQEFNPNNNDEVTQAYVKAYQAVDRNVSYLLETANDQDVVALMGDHGMDPIHRTVNLAAILPELAEKTTVVVSGSLAMVYDRSNNQQADQIGAKLYEKLKDLTYEGKKVLGTFHQKSAGKPWNYGEAKWAFTGASGFWLRFFVGESTVFAESSVGGMHGHDANLPQMATAFMFKAPNIKPQKLEKVGLIDAVPTFVKHLGIEPPNHCAGKPMTFSM